mgnify:CR=1 FL=1
MTICSGFLSPVITWTIYSIISFLIIYFLVFNPIIKKKNSKRIIFIIIILVILIILFFIFSNYIIDTCHNFNGMAEIYIEN